MSLNILIKESVYFGHVFWLVKYNQRIAYNRNRWTEFSLLACVILDRIGKTTAKLLIWKGVTADISAKTLASIDN